LENKAMTPKEKAVELVEFFTSLNHVKLSDYSRIEWPTAKQCTLKVANEVIDTLYEHHYDSASGAYEYWTEVKEELEKL
jgi:hypothetical protein